MCGRDLNTVAPQPDQFCRNLVLNQSIGTNLNFDDVVARRAYKLSLHNQTIQSLLRHFTRNQKSQLHTHDGARGKVRASSKIRMNVGTNFYGDPFRRY